MCVHAFSDHASHLWYVLYIYCICTMYLYVSRHSRVIYHEVSALNLRRISIRYNIYYLLELPRGHEISGVNDHGKRLPYSQIFEGGEKYG